MMENGKSKLRTVHSIFYPPSLGAAKRSEDGSILVFIQL